MGRGKAQRALDVLDVAVSVPEVCRHDTRDTGDRDAVRVLRLSRRGLSWALVSESRTVRGSELRYKSPHKLARSGAECAKAAFNVKNKRGWVWIR